MRMCRELLHGALLLMTGWLVEGWLVLGAHGMRCGSAACSATAGLHDARLAALPASKLCVCNDAMSM